MAGDMRSPRGDMPPSRGHHRPASCLPPRGAGGAGGPALPVSEGLGGSCLGSPGLAKAGLKGLHGTGPFISHLEQ